MEQMKPNTFINVHLSSKNKIEEIPKHIRKQVDLTKLAKNDKIDEIKTEELEHTQW